VIKAVPDSGEAWYQKGYAHYHLKQFKQSVCPTLAPVSAGPLHNVMRNTGIS
jgi:hypothetical protein